MKRYRHSRILALLESRAAAKVAELAEILDVSVGTIRRDLAELEKSGSLQRTHGGAFAASEGESGFTGRLAWNQEKKQAVGRAAAAMLPSGSVVFIDGGTSTEGVVPFLASKNALTVITCGLNIAVALLRYPYISTIFLGGEVHVESRTVTGPIPAAQLESFGMRFDAAILSVSGISAGHGATNRMLERLSLKRTIIRSSKKTILIGDSSKVGKVYLGLVAPLSDFTHCLVDDDLSPQQRDELSAAGNFTFVPVAAQR